MSEGAVLANRRGLARFDRRGTDDDDGAFRRTSRRDLPTTRPRGEMAAGTQVMKGMVLVIDDDEGVRAVMAAALEDDGWTVETADNGRSALQTLQWVRPEAIILDLRMPVMDGLTFAAHYRQLPEPRAPLILMSATVTPAAVTDTGAVAGLRKPIDLTDLLDCVQQQVDAFRQR